MKIQYDWRDSQPRTKNQDSSIDSSLVHVNDPVNIKKPAGKTYFNFSKGIYGSQFPIQFVQIRSHFADPIEKQKWHMIDPGKIIIN